MSRFSEWKNRVKLGPIVTKLVKLAESLLGSGTGALKKKLVTELIAIILRKLKEAGKEVPENATEMVEELTETTVAVFNETGAFTGGLKADTEPLAEPAEPVKTTKPAPARRGRPAGSKNKGTQGTTISNVPTYTAVPVEEEELDLADFGIDEDEL